MTHKVTPSKGQLGMYEWNQLGNYKLSLRQSLLKHEI